jgi:Ser/Thr protein kinase RdoA (MazF antagonist)
MTDDERAARTQRAVAAATAAGTELGLTVRDPQVLYDVFSVIVRLDPAPVVVRVPTVLPDSALADLAGYVAQQRRELAVTGWLADRGFPVVRPSPLVPAEPVAHDGFSMTFWQLVEQDDREIDGALTGTVTAELHAALAEYPGELDFLFSLDPFVPASLAALDRRPDLLPPDDLDRARREWELLRPVLGSEADFRTAFPNALVRPVHGDAPGYNIISTPDGPLCSDFEHIMRAPAEWDLTLVGDETLDAYDRAAAEHGLPPLDRRLLDVLGAARMLQVVACLDQAPQQPAMLDGLAQSLVYWREAPLAGGL